MSKDTLRQELRDARPKLKAVSPLSYWIILVMGWFNIFLGSSFILAIDEAKFTASLLIVNDLLTFKFWGAVFIVIGILKLLSLKTNNWAFARNTLFIGVSVKAAWMVALVIRTFISPGTVFVSLLWVTIALLQIGAYIWFMPPSTEGYKQRREDRE